MTDRWRNSPPGSGLAALSASEAVALLREGALSAEVYAAALVERCRQRSTSAAA